MPLDFITQRILNELGLSDINLLTKMCTGIVNKTVKNFKGEPIGNGFFDVSACVAISIKMLYGLNDKKSLDQGIYSLDFKTKTNIISAV